MLSLNGTLASDGKGLLCFQLTAYFDHLVQFTQNAFFAFYCKVYLFML